MEKGNFGRFVLATLGVLLCTALVSVVASFVVAFVVGLVVEGFSFGGFDPHEVFGAQIACFVIGTILAIIGGIIVGVLVSRNEEIGSQLGKIKYSACIAFTTVLIVLSVIGVIVAWYVSKQQAEILIDDDVAITLIVRSIFTNSFAFLAIGLLAWIIGYNAKPRCAKCGLLNVRVKVDASVSSYEGVSTSRHYEPGRSTVVGSLRDGSGNKIADVTHETEGYWYTEQRNYTEYTTKEVWKCTCCGRQKTFFESSRFY